MEVLSFDDQTPQTVTFRAPFNPFALDAILILEMAESPEGSYSGIQMTALDDRDEIIDGILYRTYEVNIPGGPNQASFFRLNARLGGI